MKTKGLKYYDPRVGYYTASDNPNPALVMLDLIKRDVILGDICLDTIIEMANICNPKVNTPWGRTTTHYS